MTLKNIILAAAAVAATASAVSANSFDVDTRIDEGDRLELGLIVADNTGTVEVYDYRLGTQGKLLGSAPIHAGANTQVFVSTGLPATSDVLAVLTVNGQAVASQVFDVERD